MGKPIAQLSPCSLRFVHLHVVASGVPIHGWHGNSKVRVNSMSPLRLCKLYVVVQLSGQNICCCEQAKGMISMLSVAVLLLWLMPLMSGGISVEAGVHDVNVYEDVKLGRCDRNKACVQGLCPWYTQEFWWRCWCGCVRGVGPADYLHVAFPSACLNRHAYCISSYDSISCVCTVCLKNQHPSQMCS